MFEKTDNKWVALVAPVGFVVALSAGVVHAEGKYLGSASGGPVLSGAKDCWNSPGSPEQLLELCGDVIAVAEPMMADSDGDGVADDKDECPNTPKGVAVTAFGCPLDSDGDGVADFLDRCPGTPAGATVDAEGCAPSVVAVSTTIDGFAFDSSELSASQMGALDEVAASAGGQSLEVIGHTDSTGPEAYNQLLSERRAQSAADYLSSKGATDLTVVGMGESAPVADNGTSAGRAANRRVEVKSE